MTTKQSLKLFEGTTIRTIWDSEKEEWFFSVADVCNVLSGSQAKDPNAYWRKLKQRLKAEGSEVVTIVTDWIEKLNLQGFLVTSLSTQSSAQSSARENFFSKKYIRAGS